MTAVQEVLENPAHHLMDKTSKMNDLLNNIVPYFRCSDEDIVKIYYYLWSIHLMYYTQGDQGGFQLKFVSISRVINHMTCYNSSALNGGKLI